jgi:MFS superfamily sulfate permease-like transporter
VLGAVMSAKVSSLLPASWQAAHLPALNPAQLAGVKSAVSVGVAPVTSSTPPPVASAITHISHATSASGMHAAFLVAAVVALAGRSSDCSSSRGTPRPPRSRRSSRVATECGMGRRSRELIPRLLEIHARVQVTRP